MMHWLSIDTAMNACGVGVRRADGEIFEISESMDRGQSERLMPMVLDVCTKAGLQLADIGAYAVTTGPGTFTGLRVGISTIRALSQVSGKPAIGVSTFDALACGVPQRPTCFVIETKRTDFYVAGPAQTGACLSPDELREYLQPDWLLAGDAVDRAVAETGCTNEVLFIKAPKAADIIAIAEKQTPNGYPVPAYLRAADVSISKRKIVQII